jgi:hypothetical protein
MLYQISDEIINSTRRCDHRFKCLTVDSFQICPIKKPNPMKGICFIKMENPMRKSSYCLSLGNSNICLCPTRRELYERYKI